MGFPSPTAGQRNEHVVRERLSGAQAFVACLKQEGVAFVFGVPGGQTLSIMDALYDEPSIRFVVTRHEGAAACMADAYGRITGKPGIALATTGPGATNLITGIGGAHRDSSPVIVVTCNNRRRHIGLDDNQDADHIPLFRQFTKHVRFVPDASGVPHATREAFRIALAGNPGPVLLDFARDAVEEGDVEFEPLPPEAYRATARPVPAPDQLRAALACLMEADRPLIWAGKGAILADAGEEIMAFARRIGAPVITTYNGIGAVPGDDPLVFGPRSRGGTQLSEQLVREADAVLAIGVSFNAATTNRWSLPIPRRLVQIDIDANIIGRHYPIAAGVVGDARAAIQGFSRILHEMPAVSYQSWLDHARSLQKAWREKVHPPEHATSIPIKPQWIMHEAAALLDDDVIVIADAGNPGIWTHLLPIRHPRAYLKPVGFGNMAFGLPAAIAARLAAPAKRVLLFVGDGSLGMSLGELETAIRMQTPIAIVVMNDLAYGNIKQEELHYHGQRYIGVDFTDVPYADVARAMGADGERVTRPQDVRQAIARALASPLPYLVDMRIDGAENVWRSPI